jgi:hypothetical protein
VVARPVVVARPEIHANDQKLGRHLLSLYSALSLTAPGGGGARPLPANACAVAPKDRRPGHDECLGPREALQSRVLCRRRIPRPDSPWRQRRHHFRLVAGFLRAVDRGHQRTRSKREHRRAEDPSRFAVTHRAQRLPRCRSYRPADVEVAVPVASICICGHATYCAMAEPRLHLEHVVQMVESPMAIPLNDA